MKKHDVASLYERKVRRNGTFPYDENGLLIEIRPVGVFGAISRFFLKLGLAATLLIGAGYGVECAIASCEQTRTVSPAESLDYAERYIASRISDLIRNRPPFTDEQIQRTIIDFEKTQLYAQLHRWVSSQLAGCELTECPKEQLHAGLPFELEKRVFEVAQRTRLVIDDPAFIAQHRDELKSLLQSRDLDVPTSAKRYEIPMTIFLGRLTKFQDLNHFQNVSE